MKPEERWRPVVGFEGLYEVSSLGRIVRLSTGETLNHSRMGAYRGVSLRGCGTRQKRYVHRVILDAFMGAQPSLEANHIDGVKNNNRLDNLEWCTSSENKLHAVRTGLIKTGAQSWPTLHPERMAHGDGHYAHLHPEKIARGEARRTHLKTGDVLEIRRLAGEGTCYEEIAMRFNLSRGGVKQIVHRRRWGHVP